MVYMKLIHPFLAPFVEPAFNKVVAWIWGPQAVYSGCPIRPKNKKPNETEVGSSQGDTEPSTSSSKSKEE